MIKPRIKIVVRDQWENHEKLEQAVAHAIHKLEKQGCRILEIQSSNFQGEIIIIYEL